MKHQIQIQIQLCGRPSRNNYPDIDLVLNEKMLFSGQVIDIQNFVFNTHTSRELNSLEIFHKNKTNQDTVVNNDGVIVEDRSIEIKALTINGRQVKDTVLYNSPFYVDWPANIREDYIKQNQTVPEFIKNTLYFGFNGKYVYQFMSDPQREHFRQLWLDEIQAHQNQQIVENGSEKFNRYGEKVNTNQEFNLTIFDLDKLITSNDNLK